MKRWTKLSFVVFFFISTFFVSILLNAHTYLATIGALNVQHTLNEMAMKEEQKQARGKEDLWKTIKNVIYLLAIVVPVLNFNTLCAIIIIIPNVIFKYTLCDKYCMYGCTESIKINFFLPFLFVHCSFNCHLWWDFFHYWCCSYFNNINKNSTLSFCVLISSKSFNEFVKFPWSWEDESRNGVEKFIKSYECSWFYITYVLRICK